MQDLLDLDLEEQKLIDSLAIDLRTLRTATKDFGSTMRISKAIDYADQQSHRDRAGIS